MVRRDQIDTVTAESTIRFEDALLNHARKFFPGECSRRSSTELRDLIRASRSRAERHGFLAEREICKFMNIVFVLGENFDDLPWAERILQLKCTPARKLQRLYEAALENEGRHGGPPMKG